MTKPSQASNNPLVSIIIPCYNYGRYLREAIESALNQTYQPLGITVINDGSQDNTQDVASECASKYGIKFVNNKHQGLAHTLNPAIRTATSEYVMKLDADDKLDPYYVEKTLKVLLENLSISFIYTNVRFFGKEERIVQHSDYNLPLLKRMNYIHGSVLMRRSHFLQTGGFDPALSFLEDWDLWLSFAEKGFYGKLLPEPLLLWRRHGKSRNLVSLGISKLTTKKIQRKHPSLFTTSEIRASERRLIFDRIVDKSIELFPPKSYASMILLKFFRFILFIKKMIWKLK